MAKTKKTKLCVVCKSNPQSIMAPIGLCKWCDPRTKY